MRRHACTIRHIYIHTCIRIHIHTCIAYTCLYVCLLKCYLCMRVCNCHERKNLRELTPHKSCWERSKIRKSAIDNARAGIYTHMRIHIFGNSLSMHLLSCVIYTYAGVWLFARYLALNCAQSKFCYQSYNVVGTLKTYYA